MKLPPWLRSWHVYLVWALVALTALLLVLFNLPTGTP